MPAFSPIMKKTMYNHNFSKKFIAFAAALGIVFCSRPDQIIYQPSLGDIRSGSIYYATENCSSCHGVDLDGKGSAATKLKIERNITTPGFTGKPAPEITPVRYFKAITKGTANLEDHTYHALTDRARWAIAHFLFSKHEALSGTARDKHLEQAAKDFAEASKGYAESGDRRWIMGYNLPGEREKGPEVKGTASLASSAASAQAAVEEYDSEGSRLYAKNCSSCHGIRGEGASLRTGLIKCKEEGKRLCASYVSTASPSANFALHNQSFGWIPDFSALTGAEIELIQNYIASAGQPE
jgi:mono/diheme cytochrome c family protein